MIRTQTTTLIRAPLAARSNGKRFASHGPVYHEPSGYLFAEKPPAKGQKRRKESWESIYYIGLFGTVAFGFVGYMYKPDSSIQSWALEEAKRRMEARGDLPKYVPSGYDVVRPYSRD
ncbi:Ndufb11, NADH dehydrogenase 1 beta subcomplex subunit [Naematelia encephala]|uniref:NADH dehydrogenase [ubiquinone] 1 beta subcomplex subunit 11, mitochondrial n=1 Tax=Naematelia encephala TaxID=71784 RepID=A0A1Y2BH29_9TREE|nr:Ndufb11, NADH dehydrogenase 1 beta subcomplex subunit [Naematelia encephala]